MSFVSRLAGAPEEPVIDAIARNLEAVLNAKQGYAGAVETFGLAGFEGFVPTEELFAAFLADILGTVRRHEPRLKEPRLTVRPRYRSLWLRFSLSGRVDRETYTFTLLFHGIERSVRVTLGEPQ